MLNLFQMSLTHNWFWVLILAADVGPDGVIAVDAFSLSAARASATIVADDVDAAAVVVPATAVNVTSFVCTFRPKIFGKTSLIASATCTIICVSIMADAESLRNVYRD